MNQLNRINQKFITEKELISREELERIAAFPEKILQFGEGKFLRGFMDWMVNTANRKGVFRGRVVIVPPLDDNLLEIINGQDGFFTMFSRGKIGNNTIEKREIVASVSRAVSPRLQWRELESCLEQPLMKIIVSNTTEAGIFYRREDFPCSENPPVTYPARLTALLYHRYKHFNGEPGSGMLILPLELIEENGSILREIVEHHARDWQLPDVFLQWLEQENLFLNTLVDRIVTGISAEERESLWQELGYCDELINAAEVFHQFFIEADPGADNLFPLHQAGLEVKWVEDLKPYRTRKVRLLNGAHTATVALALLRGLPTVREAVNDAATKAFMESFLFDEAIPATVGAAATAGAGKAGKAGKAGEEELLSFAKDVLERFDNPVIEHYWQDISTNSVSKFKIRILPSFFDYLKANGYHKTNDNNKTNDKLEANEKLITNDKLEVNDKLITNEKLMAEEKLPRTMCLALAALIALYRGSEPDGGEMLLRTEPAFSLKEEPVILSKFYTYWQEAEKREGCSDQYDTLETLTTNILRDKTMWGSDLTEVSGLVPKVTSLLHIIISEGVTDTLLKKRRSNRDSLKER